MALVSNFISSSIPSSPSMRRSRVASDARGSAPASLLSSLLLPPGPPLDPRLQEMKPAEPVQLMPGRVAGACLGHQAGAQTGVVSWKKPAPHGAPAAALA